ncbi:MAG: Rne/Rng family ribonuclease [Betaproteobacteria bacterium]|nr:Rne/Rng family ribonuclease [Betaproteobacteria bacterium]
MKRMLFNATQAEELRVAIVDGQKLIDLDIESAAKEQRKSNIYKGIITRIEPSLEAAFVDYGEERHGFLPFKAIARSSLQNGSERGRIHDLLKEGQELIVQVDKDERSNKGAALSTFISLAGRYLVLMPNNPRGGGISRRVDGEDRIELREVMDQLDVPPGMSLISRTAAIGRQAEELQWDLNYLKQLWRAIEEVARSEHNPRLIYQEDSLVIRAIRDYFQPEIGEILIDTDSIFQQARDFMSFVIPNDVHRVKRYWDDVPLFSRFQIEHQIESAFGRQVNLPSGGAIVIDYTEALVAVDVNSGRATRGADIEETAFRTNLEAVDEIARQLRLRDLGGLIVIDFIDMESAKHQREVETRLKEALKYDRARIQMGKISRFGLMELSRQRLRPGIAETSYISCPRCTGTGHIRSTESAALHVLRILEEESMKEGTVSVRAQVPVEVATFLLNEKRHDIQIIEARHKVSLLLIPNMHLETPAHNIVRLKSEDLKQDDGADSSYRTVTAISEEKIVSVNGKQEQRPRQEAVLKHLAPEQPAPIVKAPEKKGLFSRLLSLFISTPKEAAPVRKTRGKGRNALESKTEPRHDKRDGRGENRRGKTRNRKEEREEARETRNEDKRNERSAETKNRAARIEPIIAEEPIMREPGEAVRDPRPKRGRQERAKPAVPEAATPAEAPVPAKEGAEINAQGSGRKRGRSRGNDRRRAELPAEPQPLVELAGDMPDALKQVTPVTMTADSEPPEQMDSAPPEQTEKPEPTDITAATPLSPIIAAAPVVEPLPVAPVITSVVAPVALVESTPIATPVAAVTLPVTPVAVSVAAPIVTPTPFAAALVVAPIPAVMPAPVVAPDSPVEPVTPSVAPAASVEPTPTVALSEPPVVMEAPIAPLPEPPEPAAVESLEPVTPPVTVTHNPPSSATATVEEAAATLEDTGLILVQTRHAAPDMPTTKPLGRPRRKPPASGAVEELMVMVETRQ